MEAQDAGTLVPDNFTQLEPGWGFNDLLAPIYSCDDEGSLDWGFVVLDKHCNAMGSCHGGVLLTFMDIALGRGIRERLGRVKGLPTINLSMDFVSAGQKGEWLRAEIDEPDIKNSFGFTSGRVMCGDRLVARATGVFRVYRGDKA